VNKVILSENQDLFHLLVESVKDYAIFTTDTEGKITTWNTGAERFFGYMEAEILGQSAAIIYTPEDRESGVPERELSTAAAKGRAEDERWHLRKDGSRFWVSGMVTPLRDEAGALCGFVKVGRDLTESKIAEVSRLEIEERHRVIAETASDAIITVDESSTILFVNPAAGKIFGHSFEELKGASLNILMPDYLRHVHSAGMKRYVETGKKHIPWTGVELPGLHKSGREIPVEISFGEFVKDGRRFFTGIIRDISERKRIERRLAAEHAVTRILAEEKTLMESAPRIIQAICESLSWDMGALWHVDNAADTLRLVEMWHDPAVEISEFTQMSRNMTFAPGVGLPGHVWQSSAPVWNKDVTQESNFPRKHVAAKEGLHGAFGFPIIIGDEVFGVMEFFSREIREPDEALLEMMASMSSQIGQFIGRRRSEAALQRREQELSDFIENATVGLRWMGSDGTIIWANQTELDLLGYTREEYFGHHIAEFHADQDVIGNILQRLTGDEALHDYESRMRCKDGTIKHVLINSNVFREDGKFVHTRCFTHDVTERRQIREALRRAHDELEQRVQERTAELVKANEELQAEIVEREWAEEAQRASEGMFRELLELLPIGVYSCDRDGLIKHYNRRAIEMWGCVPALNDTDERFCGSYKMYLPDGTLLPRDQIPMAQVLRTGVEMRGVEAVFERPDHSRIMIEVHIIPLKNAEGNVTGAINCFHDITERKRRVEALRESERQLAAAQQVAHLGSWELDVATDKVTWSEEMYHVYGLRHDEFRPSFERFIERVHPNDRERIKKIKEKAFRDHQPFSFEHRIVRLDGTVRMLLMKGEVITDDTGQPVKLRGIGQDITERKEAEDAHREIERSYRGLVEFSPDAVIVHSEGQIRYINPAGLKLLGAAHSDQIVSRQMLDFVHPDFHEIVKSRIQQTQQGILAQFIEEKFVRLNGEAVAVEVGGIGIHYLGKPATQVIVREITERKRLEAERDNERQLLGALFDQLPVGVLIRDMEGKYVRTNRSVCDILGFEYDGLIGLTTDKIVTLLKMTKPDGTPFMEEELASSIALKTERPSAPVEVLITTPAGEVRQINSNGAPVILESGAVVGSVAVIVDVTEQHALQEQLRQSQKMESIGTLAGGVAHDFNNLLTAILGNTQLALRRLSPNDPLQGRLIEVEKAGNRATSLTRQLLAFSRRQRLERKTLNLNNTVNDIMKMLKRIIGEDVDVHVQETGSLSPVFADPAQIEQVVMNLAVNARDAMPGGGTLTIETRNVTLGEAYRREHLYAKPGKYVEMIVSDTGTGIDAETRKRIFEPFFTTKEAGKGTGLGLAMVFGIVKQHGGMIEVESDLGQGTAFHVYLPVDEKAASDDATEDVLPPLRGGTETVLVAEDEEALRALAGNILEESGYTVLLAKDGAEAVEIYEANRERISLILMDIVMPRMGGREAYERISQLGGAVPVLFMTGYSAEIVQYDFVKQNKFIEDAGAVLMQKPYSVEMLGRKVREVLDQTRKI
jgi:PAS domain S-box-containing protein